MQNDGILAKLPELNSKESNILHRLHQLKLERVQNGEPVFDFSMINPDIPPSRLITDKLVQASLKSFNHKYGVSRGIKKLREAFAYKYLTAFGVTLDSTEEVCVTLGCKDATLHLFKIISSTNKKVAVFEPCYPPYLSAASYHRVEVVRVPWQGNEDTAIIELTKTLQNGDVGSILLNFPMNPCGDIVTESFWVQVVNLAKKYQCLVINDFAYGELVHRGKSPSILSVPGAKDIGIEIYTMSKAYSIPGWRVAAVLGNKSIVDGISRIKSQIDYGMFLPVQIAAASALCENDSIVSVVRDTYARRLRVLVDGLTTLGWQTTMPAAGTCVWTKVPNKISSQFDGGFKIAERLLSKSGIAVLPGEAFGPRGSGNMRFAAVLSEDKIREALGFLGEI